MKSILYSLFLLSGIALLAGCNKSDYKRTSSGVLYKIYRVGNGKRVKPGQWIKLHYRATISDSLLVNTYEHIPAYGMYDSTAKNTHDFVDFLGEMNVGDSVVFLRNTDTLQRRGFLMYNGKFQPGTLVKGYIKILNSYPRQEDIFNDQQLETEKEKAREIAGLERYLKEKGIQGYTKTANGVFIKVDQTGSGPKADSGMKVSVNYTGMLKNGTRFDSNVDPAFGHVGPFEFVAGTGAVIPGWDEAIVQLNKGAKARLFIPAMMGYASNPQGDKIPAFSDLIFDIEVKDVAPNVAPAAVPAPQIIPDASQNR